MAGLFYCFDSSFSFEEEAYYFHYKGILFKLLNGGENYQHCLVVLTEDIHHPNEIDNVALEFLACLALDANMPVIYKGTFGLGAYTERLFRSSVRNMSTIRGMPLSVIKHKLPKKIPNITNRNEKIIIAMYQESLFLKRDLPHYAFLNYWKILSILENNDNSSEKIFQLVGEDFFNKIGYTTKEAAKGYLKEKLRNRIGHVLGKGKKDIFMMDPEIYFELGKITYELSNSIVREVRKFLDNNKPVLNLYSSKNGDMFYMTKKKFYSAPFPLK